MEGSTPTMGETLNTALTQSITGEKIISEFVKILPWVALMVVAAFLIYESRKMVKGASHAKVNL